MKMIFSHYWRAARRYRKSIFGIFLGILIAVSAETLAPFAYKNLADLFAAPANPENISAIFRAFWFLLVIYAGQFFAWRVIDFFLGFFDAAVMRDLEKKTFSAILRQKMDFFENSFSGSLVKKAGRFVRSFERISDWIFFWGVKNALFLVVMTGVFFATAPKMAIFFLIWATIFLVGNIFFAKWKIKFDAAVAATDSKIGGFFADAFSNILTVKSFARENAEKKRISKIADDLFSKRLFNWNLENLNYGFQALLMFFIELFLIFLMIKKWRAGNFSVGEFIFFQSFLLNLFSKLWEFGRSLRDLFSAIADAREMAEILEKNDFEKSRGGDFPKKVRGKIQFQNIFFGYENQKNHFENFSLEIAAGQKIGLVGPSGAGKTTIAKLLFRFSAISGGKILIDGKNISEISIKNLRKNISLVPQNPELFHRTIRENISFSGEFSDDEIWAAAKKARAADFLKKMPQKLDALVGERGVKLSGGQRQRVAIARAFLENAPIVILDEATSALDSITERQIQIAIFELLKNKTAIVIAHRLSTILQMDKIVFLENGKIAEIGSHRELLAKKGKYEKMWRHQNGDFLDADF